MKIMTIVGTRPEIIRLSRVIPLLDKACDHILVHTGQNYDRNLNDIFFEQLGLRNPDYVLECKSDTLMGQIGIILTQCEQVMDKEKPDRLLILGDTNSALSAIVAKRMGIPVFHMEAGNRCYDDRVPEEVNRRIIDHSSDILMPYTERSRANLLQEGIKGERIYVTGNPIFEVLNHYSAASESSTILEQLKLQAQQYLLVTLHRSENVDNQNRLAKFIEAFRLIHKEYKMPLVCSLHPRTRSQLAKQGQSLDGDGILAIEPVGLFDFVKLEKNAFCVLSDSGTVQEECCIIKVPNVTLRDVTERPETVEAGSNFITGCEIENILRGVNTVVTQQCDWDPPREYLPANVSNTVARIIFGEWKSSYGA